jgi:hypothetical protein
MAPEFHDPSNHKLNMRMKLNRKYGFSVKAEANGEPVSRSIDQDFHFGEALSAISEIVKTDQ